MSDVVARTFHSTQFMGPPGHYSFGWDEAEDDSVLPMIEEAMRAGFVFWFVKRNPLREEQVRHIEDVEDSRHVIIRGVDSLRGLFSSGTIGLVADDRASGPVAQEEPPRRARTAAEAVRGDTVAHAPLRGG